MWCVPDSALPEESGLSFQYWGTWFRMISFEGLFLCAAFHVRLLWQLGEELKSANETIDLASANARTLVSSSNSLAAIHRFPTRAGHSPHNLCINCANPAPLGATQFGV
jgi:hypothetical protein